MAQQTINTTDSPETGRAKINANFTEVYDIDNLLPSQQGNSGKVLTSSGTTVSWQTIADATFGKKFVSVLTQTGTSAISLGSVIKNTLSSTPTTSRQEAGVYRISLSNEFVENKTQIAGSSNVDVVGSGSTTGFELHPIYAGEYPSSVVLIGYYYIYRSSASAIDVVTLNTSFTKTDLSQDESYTINIPIDITVFP